MWIREYSKLYKNIRSEDIWQIWIDVNNWAEWHGDLDYCKMNGEFKIGNFFMLKPKGAPAVKIVITEIDKGRSFTDYTKFFGAKMFDTHSLKETKDGLILTNKLIVTGWLKWFWIKIVVQNIADTVPDEMDALVRLAQKRL